MAENEEEMRMENVNEYVLDENKVVTYKWLSITLGIHVNQSKNLLQKFVNRVNDGNQISVQVTYFVSGTCQSKEGRDVHKVCLARDRDLEAVKRSFSRVDTVHVYSVHKSQLKDSNAIYMTDYDCVKENLDKVSLYSAIKCAEAQPRSREEIQKRENSMPTPMDTTTFNGGGTNYGTASASSKFGSKAAKKKKPLSAMEMFASKAKAKKEAPPSSTSKPEKEVTTKDEKEDSQNDFFGKAAVKRKNTSKKTDDTTNDDEKEGSQNDFFVVKRKNTSIKTGGSQGDGAKIDSKQDEKIKASSESAKPTKKPQPKAAAQYGKKSQAGGSKGKAKNRPKPMKRIQRPISDSSSEEDSSEEEELSLPPPSPPPASLPSSPEPEPPASPDQKESPTAPGGPPRRKRKRVLKDKTMTDEEGFLITEKVWEEYSTDASDHGDEVVVADQPKPATASSSSSKAGIKSLPKKPPPPINKTKQSSLMNFFRKK